MSLMQAGFIGYVCAAAAYLVLAVLVASWSNRTLTSLLVAAASLATALWAGMTAYHLGGGGSGIGWGDDLLEIIRSCLWSILLLSTLYWLSPIQRSGWAAAIAALGLFVAAAALVLGALPNREAAGEARFVVIVGHLVLSLLGIALVENLFRNSPRSRYWRIKYLCLGLGALFTFDFFFYSDALLFRRLSIDVFLARGAVNFLAMPLLAVYAVRGREEGPEIAVSRGAALHSATLVGAGLYLIAMAAVGYYVQQFGGTWSNFLQALFLFGAALLFLASVFSASFRAHLRVLIEKNLLRYRFDYRAEWLRFIRTTSERQSDNDLRNRVIQAICDIMDSPEGALWLAREGGPYLPVASWNLSRWALDRTRAIGSATPLVRFLERTQWIIEVDEFAAAPEHYDGLSELPSWLSSIDRLWLIVPLIWHERIFGIMLIGRPRADRKLTWEDFDLLKIVGRQAASYLAEEETSQALAEARQFEAFNKRFAFVAHDIKNLASQLSLIVSNAERHRGNEAFQRDTHETLRQSVDKLNRMLRQLAAPSAPDKKATAVPLAPLLGDIVASRGQAWPPIMLEVDSGAVAVAADEDRLRAVVEHLVQNAVDAVGKDGTVTVRLTDRDQMAVIEVEDDGPGMGADFVREKLFRPFATTKDTGFGIGVYESRDYASRLGGRLDVVSEPGKGTIMRMSLPIACLA